MTDERRAEIRRLVSKQIAYHLENDLKGDEQLMKEVWEEMVGEEEMTAAKAELQVILDFVRGRAQ